MSNEPNPTNIKLNLKETNQDWKYSIFHPTSRFFHDCSKYKCISLKDNLPQVVSNLLRLSNASVRNSQVILFLEL